MNKIVIFDWGGVVESHENGLQELKDAKVRVIKRFTDKLSDQEILKGWTDKTQDGVPLGTTDDMDCIRDWVTLVQKNMNIVVPFDVFKRAYEEELSTVSYYEDVVAYAHSLKDKCTIAILSNLMPFDKHRIDLQYDLSKFDKVYLSFEIGMDKPDKKVYEYVQKDLNVSPKDILFIDDDSANISMAQDCGWNTCQAFGYELEKIKRCVELFLNSD